MRASWTLAILLIIGLAACDGARKRGIVADTPGTGATTPSDSAAESLPDAAPGSDAAPPDGSEEGSRSHFTLTVTAMGDGAVRSPLGGADCLGRCTYQIPVGQVLELTVVPVEGIKFLGWSGDCVGTSCVVLVDRDRSISATFRRTLVWQTKSESVRAIAAHGDAVYAVGSFEGTTEVWDTSPGVQTRVERDFHQV